MGPFRWVKYSPIFDSNLAPLIRTDADQLHRTDLDPRVEMGPSVGWDRHLMGLFRLKLCSNGSRRGSIGLWPAGLNWHFGVETDLSSFSVGSSRYGPGVRAKKWKQSAPNIFYYPLSIWWNVIFLLKRVSIFNLISLKYDRDLWIFGAPIRIFNWPK